MKKFLIVLFLCGVCFGADWYVAKDGDNSDGLTWATAYNAIGTAVTASSSGDTIYIGAGDYVERVDTSAKELSIIGIDRDTTRITPGAGTDPAFTAGSNTYIYGLGMVPSAAGSGLRLSTASNIVIENCYCYSVSDGLSLGNVSSITLLNSHFESPYDAAKMTNTTGLRATNCIFETTGGVNAAHGITVAASGVYENCTFIATSTTASAAELGGVAFGLTASTATFYNCSFQTSAAANRTGKVFCLKIATFASTVTLIDCAFSTVGAGASGGPQDLRNETGTIYVSDCFYNQNTTYGTILNISNQRGSSRYRARY